MNQQKASDAALHSVRKYGDPKAIYKVRNGQWLFAGLEYARRNCSDKELATLIAFHPYAEEKCEHNIQNHSTRYGPIYWCDKCKKTPEEIEKDR